MKMENPRRRPVVVILGGGLSGGATAFHLARILPPEAVDIVVVEPRPTLGAGLAYSTDEPAHRINVPAAKMTLIASDLDHFTAWLAAERRYLSPGTLTLRGDLFPERRVFGQYVTSCIAPFLATGAIRHLRAEALSAALVGERYLIDLSDGSSIGADFLVLAMSHPLPGLPAELQGLAGSPRLVADPYDNRRIAAIGPSDRVLIVGTGLTSADVVASLCRRGFWVSSSPCRGTGCGRAGTGL
ncbi:MAG: FAD/NAD(P)-binding protein [Amaricoccus sp.]